MDIYETETILSQYLLFHYGTAEENLPWENGPTDALEYPARTVTEFLNGLALPQDAQALDVGCAVGRSSFELAAFCESVIGIDYSQAFIDAANTLKNEGELSYRFHEEGNVLRDALATVPAQLDRERVQFETGDAMHLRLELKNFDVVHASNLIDRLHTPSLFLERVSHLTKPGGYLIFTTPFTWLEEFTPRERWITSKAGSEAGLTAALAPHFNLIQRRDMPFLIREHRRKFQWSVAFASLWQRYA